MRGGRTARCPRRVGAASTALGASFVGVVGPPHCPSLPLSSLLLCSRRGGGDDEVPSLILNDGVGGCYSGGAINLPMTLRALGNAVPTLDSGSGAITAAGAHPREVKAGGADDVAALRSSGARTAGARAVFLVAFNVAGLWWLSRGVRA